MIYQKSPEQIADCGHYRRYMYIAETDGTHEIEHCALCDVDELRMSLAELKAESEELKTQLLVANAVHGTDIANEKEDARNAALEEAAQIAKQYGDNAQLYLVANSSLRDSAAYLDGIKNTAKAISDSIRKVADSGVGLHASQQRAQADPLRDASRSA